MKRYFLLLVLTLWTAVTLGQPAERTDSLVIAPTQPQLQEQATSAAYVSDPTQCWDQANTAYINNEFRTAITLYEALLTECGHSDKLYYNLGNAYFKEGQIGQAILNYRRALRLSPGNEDIRYNLQVAEKMTKDHIDAVPEFFVSGWIRDVRQLFSGTTWAIISLVALTLLLGSILFYLLSRRLTWRKIGFYGIATMLLLLITTLWFSNIERHEAIDRTSAVVMHEAVAVKSSPDASSTDLFILHEGTAVEITNRMEGWCEITIADGKKGWMECAKLETI